MTTLEQRARSLAQYAAECCQWLHDGTPMHYTDRCEAKTLEALSDVRRETLREAWHIAKDGCLVPPDGGSPTEDEVAVCERIATNIQALIDTPASEAPAQSKTEPPESNLGHVIWHVTEEGSGPDVGISIGLGSGKTLWIGEITDRAYAEGGEDAKALGDSGGWWLMMYPESIPFAKFADGEQAREFADQIEALARAAMVRTPDPRDAEIKRRTVEMPLSDINNLDAVVHALGIEDSETTPGEAVAKLHAEIKRLRALVRINVNQTDTAWKLIDDLAKNLSWWRRFSGAADSADLTRADNSSTHLIARVREANHARQMSGRDPTGDLPQ